MKNAKTSIRIEKGLRLFCPNYKTADGELRPVSDWWIEFRDQTGRPRRIPAFSDKQQSIELARKLKKLVAWKVSGELPDPAISRWIEEMSEKMRHRLAIIGLLDGRRVAASRLLAEHLADWKSALLAKGNTARHAELVTSRAKRVIDGCGFALWSDISASRIMEFLNELRKHKKKSKSGKENSESGKTISGISAQTFNFYLQAIKQFCRWMVKDRRVSESPLAHLDGLNVKTDRRHDRRAFAVDELRWLLQTTNKGPKRFGMTGSERVLLYRLAAETGFRRGELASLTSRSFDLDSDEPGVIVSASYAKARRERKAPLRADLVNELRSHLKSKPADAPTFKVPPRDKSAKMLRADLERARAAWLEAAATPDERAEREKTSFCVYRDGAGRYLDFHSLRHTRGVWLFEHHKAHPREVQELMGVSSLSLVDRYTRSFRLTDLSVIERGPDLSLPNPAEPEAAKATGTDGNIVKIPAKDLACFLARFGGKDGNVRQQGRMKSRSAGLTQNPISQRTTANYGGRFKEPPSRVELETAGLQNRCSAN